MINIMKSELKKICYKKTIYLFLIIILLFPSYLFVPDYASFHSSCFSATTHEGKKLLKMDGLRYNQSIAAG